jgi:hypothetical protein
MNLKMEDTMQVRPFVKEYWERQVGPITDAENNAAGLAAMVAAGAGKGKKKIKRAGLKAIRLKRKAQR